MASSQDIILGIDLGTTYTCAAYVENGQPKIIPSEKGYASIPSVVALTKKGEIVTGQAALDHMVVDPGNSIYGAKRLVGRKFSSMAVQETRHFMSYSIVPGSSGEAAVLLGGKTYSLSQISAYILSGIREVAQGMLDRKIDRAVITVPAYYNDNQRQAVKKAGALAGLKVEKIVNEPTAAAVAFGFKKGLDQKILVYDLGGGTFDVSILQVQGNVFRVLATGGDTFLGGVDIDNRLTAYALERFHKVTGKDLASERVAVQRVRQAAEFSKRNLSLENNVEMLLPYVTDVNGKPTDLRIKLNRELLNRLSGDLIDRTLILADQVMNSVQLKKSDIDEILLVGGQTRMPMVQEKVQKHFSKGPRKGVHPDEVVALGAAILANPEAMELEITLRDVLSIPIGISLAAGKFKIILDRNTPIPASKAYKVAVTHEHEVMIDIYQGEYASILKNEYLGTFRFPAPIKGKRGGRNLEMRFDLSAECLLTVKVRDVETGKQTMTEMVAMQDPKSIEESLGGTARGKGTSKRSGFSSFVRKMLGR